LQEHLKLGWGDSEEETHKCEEAYVSLNNKKSNVNQWWRDRLCTGVPLDSEEGNRCGPDPSAAVSFGNSIADTKISILRVAPSSEVSFPQAGTYLHQSDLCRTVVSTSYVPGAGAIPDSVEVEWKEWPRTFPGQPKNDRDLKSLRSYVDNVRAKVQRKRAQVIVRDRIPSQVIADALLSEQATEPDGQTEKSMKLFFVFMQDGLRFRWEQWHGSCIEKYGGDRIDLPRDQLLSGDWVCGEPEPKLIDR
jgi:hypothetical protein